MAYKAQIDVAVAGLDQIKRLAADIKAISGDVNKINSAKGGSRDKSSSTQAAKQAKGAKEEVKNRTAVNNLLNTSAILQGRDLDLKLKGVNVTQKLLRYQTTEALISNKRFKSARGRLALDRLRTTELKNQLKEQKLLDQVSNVNSNVSARGLTSPIQGKISQPGSPAFFAKQMQGAPSSFDPKKALPDTRLLRGAERGIDRLDREVKDLTRSSRRAVRAVKSVKKEIPLLGRLGRSKSPLRGDAFKDVGSPAYNERLRVQGLKNAPSSKLNYRGGKLLPGRAGAGGGNVLQSAAISGAFPLLFGQGPLTAAAGAVGGGLGAKFGGQMGGFAGGLAATAAVTAIQQTIAGVADLGKAFNYINPDIDKLVSTLGIAGTEEERRIKLIKETQGAQAALRAVTEEMNNKLGEKAVQNLKNFGKAAQRIGNAFAVLGAKMQGALAPILNALADIVAKPIERGQRKEAIKGVVGDDPIIKGLNQQIADLRTRGGGGRGGAKRRSDQRKVLQGEIEDRKEVLYLLEKAKTRIENNAMVEKNLSKTRKLNIELLQAKIAGNYEEVKLAQELDEEVRKRLEKGMGIMEIDIKSLETNLKLENSLEKQAELAEKLKEAWKGISNEITGSIKDGIKGLIKGTSTWADMLNNVADKFLDMALNQAFYGSILGSGGTKGGGIFGALGLFANGGRPPVGKPSIVGEKGPELFVPSSSGRIVPNHELGKGGGSTSVVVNVDASGTEVQGDDAQAKQLGTMLSAAVQAELVKQKRPGGLLAGV